MSNNLKSIRPSANLSAWQVATLLISTSYGIGFLFGSGELALKWGMAGSIYAVITALGIAVLALVAPKVWRNGMQIWQMLGSAYGVKVSKLVALLSVVWMSGVLAAQIHGGVAVMQLMGASTMPAYTSMLILIFAVSRMKLEMAAKVFAVCLIASSLALVHALFSINGMPVLRSAVPSFAIDLQLIPTDRLWAIALAVAPLVVTGADYQQFVIAARTPRAAVLGCLMAAGFLFLFGFVPAAIVLAYGSIPAAAHTANGNQIIPFVMSELFQRMALGYGWAMLIGLLTAALGSAAAIVRAMTSATLGAISHKHQSDGTNLVMILLGGLIASRGQAIIDTMVALNMVYLGAIGVVLVALLVRWKVSAQTAWFSMLAGFTASLMGYVCGWAGLTSLDTDLVSLVAGLLASLFVFGLHAVATRSTTVDLVSPVRVK